MVMEGAGRAGSLMPCAGVTCNQLPPDTVAAVVVQLIGVLVLITAMLRCRGLVEPATTRNVTPVCERLKPVEATGIKLALLVIPPMVTVTG